MIITFDTLKVGDKILFESPDILSVTWVVISKENGILRYNRFSNISGAKVETKPFNIVNMLLKESWVKVKLLPSEEEPLNYAELFK